MQQSVSKEEKLIANVNFGEPQNGRLKIAQRLFSSST
jgi:hypothetical protein